MTRADWSKLTAWLSRQTAPRVTIDWTQLDALVGGLPASATNHYPQWWHGDRPNTRAWRAAGFELDHVDLGRAVTFRLQRIVASERTSHTPRRSRGSAATLSHVDPRTAMIVLQCSARKAAGGTPAASSTAAPWPPALRQARQRIAGQARVDDQRALPAWQRYTGTFYETARDALADAVAADADIVILSGGYGIVTATEPIGTYEMVLRLTNWPRRVLEEALLDHARRTEPSAMIAFVSATTDYARLARRTPWQQLNLPAYLVTAQVADGGAMVKVPRSLGQAFTAFWRHDNAHLPAAVAVEQIA